MQVILIDIRFMIDSPFKTFYYAEGNRKIIISLSKSKPLVWFVYVSKAERQSFNG